MTEKAVYYVWLSQAKLGRNKRTLLTQYANSPEVLYNEISYENKKFDYEKAVAIVNKCEEQEISILTCESLDILPGLNHIQDKPIVLYYKGELRNKRTSAAVVGARRCTQNGKKKTLELTEQLVERNASIVSGMAKGIDSYAHTKCLLSGGYTIAVLGCGLDICYPKEHDKLMNEIAKKGLLLSEYPPGSKPYSYNFPRRNRIIAALADEIYIVEAGKKSGALITAEFGEKYGKKVYFCE